jgi:hypothetical protein
LGEANRPAARFRIDQQDQQDKSHRDCSPCEKFSADPTSLFRDPSVTNPIRHDQDVGRQEDHPNQSQHNDFSSCQTHHNLLFKRLMFTNIDGSARRWVAQGIFWEKVLEFT